MMETALLWAVLNLVVSAVNCWMAFRNHKTAQHNSHIAQLNLQNARDNLKYARGLYKGSAQIGDPILDPPDEGKKESAHGVKASDAWRCLEHGECFGGRCIHGTVEPLAALKHIRKLAGERVRRDGITLNEICRIADGALGVQEVPRG